MNLRFACDGEEEIGGHSIVEFLEQDDRGADACIIFDSAMERRGVPALCTGTRGVMSFDLEVRTGERDLHSGVYGNAALNATHALMQALGGDPPARRPAARRAARRRRAAFGRRARELERADARARKRFVKRAPCRTTAAADEFYLRTTAEPSVDVNGILGGKPACGTRRSPWPRRRTSPCGSRPGRTSRRSARRSSGSSAMRRPTAPS